MKKYDELTDAIIQYVGGNQNVTNLVHCATRLRFTLKDFDQADRQAIQNLRGVLGVVENGGQFQIIIGNTVPDVYAVLMEKLNLKSNPDSNEPEEASNQSFISKLTSTISALFTPLVGILCGSGVIKGLLMLLVNMNLLSEASGTYQILFAGADAIFYFLPIALAVTASKKFKTDTFLAIAIAGAMMYPNLIALANEGAPVNFLGIPVTLLSYASTVIPAIACIWFLSVVEKLLTKFIPSALRLFVIPALCLAIVLPISLIVIGPAVSVVSNLLVDGYAALSGFSPALAGAIFGALWQVLVVFGVHWTFVPIAMNNVALTGMDTSMAMVSPSNFAQAGASLGVFLKTKDAHLKEIAGSAALSGVFGITEPTIYGVTLKYKKVFGIAMVFSAIAGAIAGIAGCACTAVAALGVLTLPVFAANNFGMFLIACAIAYFGTAITTYLFGYKDEKAAQGQEKEQKETPELEGEPVLQTAQGQSMLLEPCVSGTVMDLKEVKDEVFASGALGKGMAIRPTENIIHSPMDGTVATVFPTGHAIGLVSDQGTELLIHIGIDTVELNGQYFDTQVKQGERVSKGDALVKVDFDSIAKAGYDTSTMMIITNSDQYKEILPTAISSNSAEAALRLLQ